MHRFNVLSYQYPIELNMPFAGKLSHRDMPSPPGKNKKDVISHYCPRDIKNKQAWQPRVALTQAHHFRWPAYVARGLRRRRRRGVSQGPWAAILCALDILSSLGGEKLNLRSTVILNWSTRSLDWLRVCSGHAVAQSGGYDDTSSDGRRHRRSARN